MAKQDLTKFYVMRLPEKPDGYVAISTAGDWHTWVGDCLPKGLKTEVHQRLISNLKHVLVGLEFKAALIVPHAERGAGKSLLFESYFQIMNFEFCVGVFSVCEGIGSAHWLRENNLDGSKDDRVKPAEWKLSLLKTFDPDGKLKLGSSVDCVKNVRDKLHQDQLGARENIDWHAFSYDAAFMPALRALQCLLRKNAQVVPQGTNLKAA
jgi:hypothetical protein